MNTDLASAWHRAQGEPACIQDSCQAPPATAGCDRPAPTRPSQAAGGHRLASIHVKKANSLPNNFVRQLARLELDPSKTWFHGISKPSIQFRLSHQIEADSARAWAPSSPMRLYSRLRLVSCVTWGSPCVARAWAPSSPMPLLPRLRLGLGAFVSNAVAAEVEAGELRDVAQSLRRQGFGAFGSNAVVAEVEA
eukprot:scaffold2082_cov130-Pinguiococcus_pyrenoidosus.AAC.1